jgi:hypothetical protein
MGSGAAFEYHDSSPSRNHHIATPLSCTAPSPQLAPPHSFQVQQAAGEPWLAAQNLTFLKRSSPASELRRNPGSSSVDIVSMPSLTSSSDGNSPRRETESKQPISEEDESGADALLMAAVAMTKFGQSPPPQQPFLDVMPAMRTPEIHSDAKNDDYTDLAEQSHSDPLNLKTSYHQRNLDSTDEERSRPSPSFKRSLEFDDVIHNNTKKRS